MEKYQLTITPSELSIRPYFGYLPKIRLFAILFILTFSAAPFLRNLLILTSDVLKIVYVLGSILLLYAVYDYLFHASVRFLFDKRTRSIYKVNGIAFKKRLMAFDEMTVLTGSEYGLNTYAIGRKKKQFVKNYSISGPFGNSKKDRAREEEYVEKILNPILEFIKS
ncbi:hypothetical protein [Chitinophaga barathri]|uniref:Uncharacterized protein n=1 Tax=Chitinophaga barathri TaxID=1647451 RepID=A0A3N4MBI4_9BACT|nr:hypothetical protein [Chitinophaga barathri]RPD41202.1 hypothetical protein EG028_11010 [Chitinophaga barathri]